MRLHSLVLSRAGTCLGVEEGGFDPGRGGGGSNVLPYKYIIAQMG